MANVLNTISPWVAKLQEIVSGISYSEVLGYVLLTVDALLSALFTEMLFKDGKEDGRDKPGKSSFLKSLILFLGACFFFFMINVGVTLALFAFLLHFMPQEESFYVLLTKIAGSYHIKFLIPLVATIFAGAALKGMTWRKRWAKSLLCFLLALSAVASSVTFLWDSVKVIQRPHYEPPLESISAVINSRLKAYPFILSGEYLRRVGDGKELIATEDHSGIVKIGEPDQAEVRYTEPNNFTEYIDAILADAYAPGKGIEDYLLSAYDLFKRGRHENDYYYIGVMWYYLYSYTGVIYDEPDLTPDMCLENAIVYYEKSLEDGERASPYAAMILVYEIQGNRDKIRECMKKAIELDVEGDDYVRYYLDPIYSWIDSEQTGLLLDDARTVLRCTDNLSMYLLYGACAIAENQDVEGAYDALCKADKYFQGKNILVKILRCICADLLSKNDTEPLYDIYQAEKSGGLSEIEEFYLIRYLFASGRYDELWGYINDVGTDKEETFSVDKAVIKASWYFDGKNENYMDVDGMKTLLQKIEYELQQNNYGEEERELLQISRSLLRDRLGETDLVNPEEYNATQVSVIEYVFSATNAFNSADYDQAIYCCETFFNTETSQSNAEISLQDLTAQEQVTLRYYMQLIYAHAHFECAKRYGRETEEWKTHMDIAERECGVFEQSSKSFFYIEERFEELRGIIHKERGEMPPDGEDKIIIEDI